MTGPDPGALRQRVTLQRATLAPSPSGSGQLLPAWADAGTFWARVETLGGRELYYARQVVAQATDRVTMRQSTSVTARDRLLFGARVLNVESVVRVGQRDEWYEILCTEQTTP